MRACDRILEFIRAKILEIMEDIEKSGDLKEIKRKMNNLYQVLAQNPSIVVIGKQSGIKDGVGIRLPNNILTKAGLKQNDYVLITADPNNPRMIIIEKVANGGYKVRSRGIIRIPNKLAKAMGLLNKETPAIVRVDNGKIIVEW